jgi:DNA-binding IclR family transcriptional regulator
MENEVRRAALPEMEKLRDDTRETVHLGILADKEIVYLEKLEGLHAIGMMSSRVGGRAPSHCTGLGKVLLAFTEPVRGKVIPDQLELKRYTDATITEPDQFANHLGKIRANGFALDKGEHEREVRCVAAPVFGQDGRTVAAISVSGPSGRIDPVEENLELINKTTQTALQISNKLGYREENT